MINPQEVNNIFRDCLFKTEEIINNKTIYEPLVVVGISVNVGFNPKRIEKNKIKISSIIDNLHDKFDNGWTFLNLCLDKNENQWTGSQLTMQELMLLGIAINKLEYCCKPDMWHLLPQGMPYIRRVG